MLKSEYGVHSTHCCILHGCKYGDKDCPVVSGEINQKYICEECTDDGIKSLYDLKKEIIYSRLQLSKLFICDDCGFEFSIFSSNDSYKPKLCPECGCSRQHISINSK